MSEDPLGFGGGDTNVARYAANSPNNWTDSSGLAVGHHWIPVSILLEFQSRFTDAAFQMGMGAYSGATDPPHNFGTYGGVSHDTYNKLVRQNLQQYLKANKLQQLNRTQMMDFISKIEQGLDYSGAVDPRLRAFNNAIRAQVITPSTLGGLAEADLIKRLREQGRNYLRGPRFLATAIGAMVVSQAGDALAEYVGALQVAANSQNFRDGVGFLADGNLPGAQEAFIDGQTRESFYNDLIAKGYGNAALNFANEYQKAVERAQEMAEEAARRHMNETDTE
jgi:hypothetical protein